MVYYKHFLFSFLLKNFKSAFQTVDIIWHRDKKDDIQYNMRCVAQPLGLGKNIWKIVFIWARIFLLQIKQPSSYNLCQVSCLEYFRKKMG